MITKHIFTMKNKISTNSKIKIFLAFVLLALVLLEINVLDFLRIEEYVRTHLLSTQSFILFLLYGIFYFGLEALFKENDENSTFKKMYPNLSKFLEKIKWLFENAKEYIIKFMLFIIIFLIIDYATLSNKLSITLAAYFLIDVWYEKGKNNKKP